MTYPTPLDGNYRPQFNPNFFNVKDFGALMDGTHSDTVAVTAAAFAASAAAGSIVFFPGGTARVKNLPLLAGVSYEGSGIGTTILKLEDGANTDLFSAQTASINLAAAANSGIAGTLNNFRIENMTLDGNKANQTSGPSYPMRFYGYNFTIRNIEVLNGFTGGTLIDWNGGGSLSYPSDQMESLLDNSKFHDNNGIGLQFGGPHDSRISNTLSWSNGSHNFHFCPNSAGTLVVNSHGYFNPNTAGVCCFLVEAASGMQFSNCIAEGSYVCNVAMLSPSCSWTGGQIFGTNPNWSTAIGMQIGQTAGNTPFAGQIKQAAGVTTAVAANGCNIDTVINECRGGSFSFQNEQNSIIVANVYQTVGTISVSAIEPAPSDVYIINVAGLAADGTFGKSGGTQFISGATDALTLRNNSGVTSFQVSGTNAAHMSLNTGVNTGIGFLLGTGADANTGIVVYANSATQSANLLALQTSAFANVLTVDKNGTLTIAGQLATGQSATAAVIATAGTITTANIGVARVAPAGNVTGVILQAGTVAAQQVVVLNESAFSVTFAAAGTSHVSGGVSVVIAGGAKQIFLWDSSTTLWY